VNHAWLVREPRLVGTPSKAAFFASKRGSRGAFNEEFFGI